MLDFKPTISSAIVALGIEGGWKSKEGKIVKWWADEAQPSQSDIDSKLLELNQSWESEEYARNRATAFPALTDQLDMLFHDMTADKGTKDGEWYKAVAKVKADNPKPDGWKE